jgi:phage replication-related protein YjqB (UPF0714/DUF867 family)
MAVISRRRALVVLGGTAAAPLALGGLEWTVPVVAVAADDAYPSNTALYADPGLTEGVDYGRRYRRHAAFDDSQAGPAGGFPQTVILAVHGGGIEVGCSELCLAIAGYHPATMAAAEPVHDYWMFEGLSLHGCTPEQAGLPAGSMAVLVGGREAALKGRLTAAFEQAGVAAVDAAGTPDLGGTDPLNLCNRTFPGAGAQLELTTPLRTAMFGTNTAAERKNTTTELFWRFVAAAREALS